LATMTSKLSGAAVRMELASDSDNGKQVTIVSDGIARVHIK
jgi:hypothetical protein